MLDAGQAAWLRAHFLLLAIGGTIAILVYLLTRSDAASERRIYRQVRRVVAGRRWIFYAPALAVVLVRVVLFPVWPIPEPAVLDEFSYLLQADTFASGRVTNPPHPLWEHFETMFVLQQPTYASVYPPGQGLVLAAGRLAGGHPWWGVWLSCGGMCCAIGWMLKAWLPPLWAVAGTAWAAVQLGLLSYWMNSYWGGAVAATGGALLLGAVVRVPRSCAVRDGVFAATGLVLLANSRPYEGLVLGVLSAMWLAWKLRRISAPGLWRVALAAGVVLVAGGLATGWYFSRVTGSWFTMPSAVYIRQYAASPVFVWQTPPAAPENRHRVLREAHANLALEGEQFRTFRAALAFSAWKLLRIGTFYLGPLLFLPALLSMFLWRTRTRMLVLASSVSLLAILIVVPLQPHYAAPLAGAIFALAMQSIRILWIAGVRGNAFSRVAASAALPIAVLVMVLHWLGEPVPRPIRAKGEVAQTLLRSGGSHLVIVTYGEGHRPSEEWVYNAAAIDGAPIVWARDMGETRNARLIQHFKGRRIWGLTAGAGPVRISEMGQR